MELTLIGTNHKNTDISTREKVAVSDEQLPSFLKKIKKIDSVKEAVIISTCNRIEYYIVGEKIDFDNYDQDSEICDFFKNELKISINDDHNHYYNKNNEEAFKHLVRVASGMDSMVVGETEIFGQVKKAYITAMEHKTTGKMLNKTFQNAFEITKLIRSETDITRGKVSIGSVAGNLASQIFGDINKTHISIIGTGEMALITAKNLIKKGCSKLNICGRRIERVNEFENKLVEFTEKTQSKKISTTKYTAILECIYQSDIIISATNATSHLITHKDIQKHPFIESPNPLYGKSLLLIDLGLPRDIDPKIHDIPSVYLYNLDSLISISKKSQKDRQKAIEKCEVIINKNLNKILSLIKSYEIS